MFGGGLCTKGGALFVTHTPWVLVSALSSQRITGCPHLDSFSSPDLDSCKRKCASRKTCNTINYKPGVFQGVCNLKRCDVCLAGDCTLKKSVGYEVYTNLANPTGSNPNGKLVLEESNDLATQIFSFSPRTSDGAPDSRGHCDALEQEGCAACQLART